ncbi:uL15 family ribosomal protein [[Eubacterium] cellulosolvens]
MATRKRRVRKQRGSRTCGWGTSGQHRDGGMKGGRGKSGYRKHNWTYVIRYGLTRRKIGFNSINEMDRKPPINIGELDSKVDKLISQGLAEKKGQKIEVDLTKLGYEKLLGSGKISRPIDIKVRKCSENAAKKIEEAGGSIISIGKEKG